MIICGATGTTRIATGMVRTGTGFMVAVFRFTGVVDRAWLKSTTLEEPVDAGVNAASDVAAFPRLIESVAFALSKIFCAATAASSSVFAAATIWPYAACCAGVAFAVSSLPRAMSNTEWSVSTRPCASLACCCAFLLSAAAWL